MDPDSLASPQTGASLVERRSVCSHLCESAARLLLLHAPAGFGKTTVMLQCRDWFVQRGLATTWLTLDGADNDVSRFLANMETAVRRLGIEPTQPGSPHDLVRDVAAMEGAFAIFLDDFESVHEPVVVELVHEILENLPREGRLVIGSRSVAQLRLGRMRVRGQVTEVDVDALRFDLAETSAFLQLRGIAQIHPDNVALLHAKTEGWGAALWLASVALRRSEDEAQFIARFSGSDRAVADYLAEDVLAHQPAEVRTFLLHTSILRQVDPALCQALCPDMDCARLLAQLESENLFLLPVASAPGSWRYHSLFADFLRLRLTQQKPDLLPTLHAAASFWYEAQARPIPAIDHALQAQDWPRTLALLDRHAESLLEQGRMRLVARWFAAIPAEVLRQHPYVRVLGIWATCFTRGPWEAEQQAGAFAGLPQVDARVQAHLAAMRPLLLSMQDRYQESYVAGLASLQAVQASSSFARSVLCNAMADIFCVLGNAREAYRLLDGARASRGDDTFNRMYTESMEGMLDLLGGRLRHAKARFRVAVDATHAASFNQTHGNAWAGVLYACVAYEGDQLDRAENLLNVYLPMAREIGLPDHMILSHVMRARIAFAAGDVDRTWRTLAELEDIGHTRKLPRVVVGARLERSRVLLMQANAGASRDEMDRADLHEIWARERQQRLLAHDLDYLTLARLRWTLAFGDAASIVTPLTRELEAARHASRGRRLLKLQLLRAMALHASGQLDAALDDTEHVLRTSALEGYVRIVLDEGPMAGAVIRHFARVRAGSASGLDPIMADHMDRLLRGVGPAPATVDEGADLPPAEALTAKELRVLVLLGEGYSNNAMGERLFISESTVRTHLRAINLKLGATSRTHAIAIARKRGLIL